MSVYGMNGGNSSDVLKYLLLLASADSTGTPTPSPHPRHTPLDKLRPQPMLLCVRHV